jgi:hypothetical protein
MCSRGNGQKHKKNLPHVVLFPDSRLPTRPDRAQLGFAYLAGIIHPDWQFPGLFGLDIFFFKLSTFVPQLVLRRFHVRNGQFLVFKPHGDKFGYAGFFHGDAQKGSRSGNGFLVMRNYNKLACVAELAQKLHKTPDILLVKSGVYFV